VVSQLSITVTIYLKKIKGEKFIYIYIYSFRSFSSCLFGLVALNPVLHTISWQRAQGGRGMFTSWQLGSRDKKKG
jgi:hypothetical protein